MELRRVDLTEISVRLLNSGRYVWTIISDCATKDYGETIETIKKIDAHLKDAFPNHVERGAGRVSQIEEE